MSGPERSDTTFEEEAAKGLARRVSGLLSGQANEILQGTRTHFDDETVVEATEALTQWEELQKKRLKQQGRG